MKNVFRLLLTAAILINSASAQLNFIITGTVAPEMQGNVQLRIDKSFLNRAYELNGATIADGRFSIKAILDRDYMVEISSKYFSFPLYVEPNDSLNVDVSVATSDYVNYLSGKGAGQNKFLQSFMKRFADDFNDSLNEIQMLSTTIDAYENSLFAKRKAQMDFVRNDPGRNNYSPSFNTFMENEVNYHYWKELYAYPIVRANSDSKILTVNPIPDVMLENFSKFKVNSDTAMVSDSYRDFLMYYVVYSTSKGNEFKKFKDQKASTERKQTVAREKLEGNIYNYWLARFIIQEYGKMQPSGVRALLSLLKTSDSDRKYLDIVNDLCSAKANSPDDVDTKAPEGNVDWKATGLVDIKGKPASIEKLKGKVVYVDYWASWCGPCRKMMPFSKQMHEQLTEKQKKDIVFLYISIDQDTAAWKKAMEDMQIEGTHFISPGNWNSKICSYFHIGSIPRYMILNKAGDIVDFNAKRPADPAVLDDLIKLTLE